MPPPIVPPESTSGLVRKVTFTTAARRTLAAVCRRDGRQAVLLAWPAGAAYLPGACYAAHDFDVILGHVAGCPIHVDVRSLALFQNRRILLDAEPGSPRLRYPTLRTRSVRRIESGHGVTATSLPALDSLPDHPRQALLSELRARFAGVFSDDQISKCVGKAIDDLRGSVGAEALPEMAARLAEYRLRPASLRENILDEEASGRADRQHWPTSCRSP